MQGNSSKTNIAAKKETIFAGTRLNSSNKRIVLNLFNLFFMLVVGSSEIAKSFDVSQMIQI